MYYSSKLNLDSISKIWNIDKDRCSRFIEYKKAEIRLLLKKKYVSPFQRRAEFICKVYDWKGESGNNYKVIIKVYGQKGLDMSVTYATTNDSPRMYIVMPDEKVWVKAYTTHFFKRFAERFMKNTNANINEVIRVHCEQGNLDYNIWRSNDETRFAYATSAGLEFLFLEKGATYPIVKTFISLEILKTTQIKAYNMVKDIIQEELNCLKDNISLAEKLYIINSIRKGYNDDTELPKMISDIYNQYYED